jgi:hypothetical protein
MAERIARSNGEVRSFGNFLHSSPLAQTAERDSRQQQRAVNLYPANVENWVSS